MKLLVWIIAILLLAGIIGPIIESQVFAWIVVIIGVSCIAVKASSRN